MAFDCGSRKKDFKGMNWKQEYWNGWILMRVSKKLSLLRRFYNFLNVDSEFKMCEDFLSEVFSMDRFLVIDQFYGICVN